MNIGEPVEIIEIEPIEEPVLVKEPAPVEPERRREPEPIPA